MRLFLRRFCVFSAFCVRARDFVVFFRKKVIKYLQKEKICDTISVRENDEDDGLSVSCFLEGVMGLKKIICGLLAICICGVSAWLIGAALRKEEGEQAYAYSYELKIAEE